MVGRRVHVNWLSCRLAAPNRQFSCGSDRDHTAASLNIVQATEVNIKHELTPAQARRCLCVRKDGGEGGIRTHGTRKGTTVFETVPIDHSGTSPQRLPTRRRANRAIEGGASNAVVWDAQAPACAARNIY